MYAIKNNPAISKKHQDKFSHINNSPTLKASDRNDNIMGMVIKNLKPKISSDSTFKSVDKNGDFKFVQQSAFVSHDTQPVNKNSEKRKDGKSNHTLQKKIKTDTSVLESELSQDSSSKKFNKFKSTYPKTYICKFCCRRFYSVEHLKQHSVSHGNKPTHVCYLCNHQTASFSALMTHYLKHSGTKGDKLEKIYAKSKADFSNIQFNIFSRPKSSYRCFKCKLSFNSKSKYDCHKCSAVVQKSEYNCAYCGHISSTVEEYRNHVQTHSESPFVCSFCKYKAPTKKQLDKHSELCKKRSKLNDEFKCDKCCVFQCKSKKELNQHLKTCEKEYTSYSCPNCFCEFQETKTYDNHLLECTAPEKETSSMKRTMKHKKKLKVIVEDKNEILCSNCKSKFTSKLEFKEHEKQCTKAPAVSNEKTSNLCSNCGDLIEISKLAEHTKTCINQSTTGEEKKSNTNDSHATRRSARLVSRKCSFIEDDDDGKKRKSLKIKIQKKPKILLKPKYRKGRQSKNPNNSFLCNYCDFTFCSKSTLLRHKRMHSGNPWYICQYCGKFFFRKDVYIRHEINVHRKSSKTVFCCYYCKLCFSESPPLKDHVLAVHKDSAFLPIKHKLSGKNDVGHSAKVDIVIKQETEKKKVQVGSCDLNETKEPLTAISTSGASEILPSSPSLSAYRCSVCSQSFEVASEVEKHMVTHAEDLQINNNDEVCKEFSSTQCVIDNSQDVHAPLSSSSKMSLSVEPCSDSNNLISDSVTFSAPCEPSDAAILDKNTEMDVSAINNKFPETDELMQGLPQTTTDTSENLECKLCSKQFSDKKVFELHNKALHKVVDWYQCLVCTASGPKQDMLEHMFMHMYKVGTFVVSCGTRNFDAIMSCLQVEDGQNKKANDSGTLTAKQDATQQNACSAENVSLVNDDELPPLREYGICSCTNNILEQTQEENNMFSLEKKDDVEDKSANCTETENLQENISTVCTETESFQENQSNNLSETEPLHESESNNCEEIESIPENKSDNCIEMESAQDENCIGMELAQDDNCIGMESAQDDNCIEMESAQEDESNGSPEKESGHEHKSGTCADVESLPEKTVPYTVIEETNMTSNESPTNVTKCLTISHSVILETENVNKIKETVEEKDPLKEEETDAFEVSVSNQFKDENTSSSHADGNVSGDDGSEKFSQLRYLLQKPSSWKYPFSQPETPNFSFETFTKPPVKHMNEELSNKPVQAESNILLSNLQPHNLDPFNSVTEAKCIYDMPPDILTDTNQSINTCLKFDINQSRGEFSETLIAHAQNQKIQNCAELEKAENFFKPCPSQNAILDFSDLIQHSFENSSPSEDNLFSYSTPTKQVDSHSSVSNREEVRTPDCTDMVNYECEAFGNSLKCKDCSRLFEDHNELSNHKCLTARSQKSTGIDATYEYKSKNTYQSFISLEDQNKIPCLDNNSDKKLNAISPEKSTGIFMCSSCSKMYSSELDLERHYKTEHVRSAQIAPQNSKCTRCQRTFSDIGELMKHSLTCLKSLFYKSALVSGCVTSTESMSTLLPKDESKTSFSDYSLNPSLSFGTVATDLSRQNSGNLLENSFNS